MLLRPIYLVFAESVDRTRQNCRLSCYDRHVDNWHVERRLQTKNCTYQRASKPINLSTYRIAHVRQATKSLHFVAQRYRATNLPIANHQYSIGK